MGKPLVFLDTSIFIAALLSSTGGSFHILSALHDKIIVRTNEFVLDEIAQVLTEKFPQQPELRQKLFLLLGLAGITILSNPPKQQLLKLARIISAKDTPILAGAIGSDFLITLDKEFLKPDVLVYAKRNKLNILRPGEYIQKHHKI